MPTKQETFDSVCAAVDAQGRPSVDGAYCRYRAVAPDGAVLKCAAGHLIPDGSYETAFEGVSTYRSQRAVSADFERPAHRRLCDLLESLGHDLDLVTALQRAHDYASVLADFVAEFTERARRVAVDHALSDAVLAGVA